MDMNTRATQQYRWLVLCITAVHFTGPCGEPLDKRPRVLSGSGELLGGVEEVLWPPVSRSAQVSKAPVQGHEIIPAINNELLTRLHSIGGKVVCACIVLRDWLSDGKARGKIDETPSIASTNYVKRRNVHVTQSTSVYCLYSLYQVVRGFLYFDLVCLVYPGFE
jgi:hypothetical protein